MQTGSRATIALFAAVVVAGCSATDDTPSEIGTAIAGKVQTISVPGCFTGSLPTDMSEVPVQGIDSTVGVWTRSDLRLSYDCGAYDVDYGTPGPVADEAVEVEGHAATLRTYDRQSDFDGATYGHVIVLHVTEPGGAFGQKHLDVAVYFTDAADKAVARSILASLGGLFAP